MRGAACLDKTTIQKTRKKKQKNNTNFGDSTKPFSSKPESGTPDPKRSDDDLVDAVRLNLPAILDHEMFPKRC